MASTTIRIKPGRKGLLHKKDHVPMGQKIPAGKLAENLQSTSDSLRKEAQFAENARKWKK